MELNKQYIQKKIQLNKEKDNFLTIMLSKTRVIDGYVDEKKDERIVKVERQQINPYFIELGFFDDISRIKVNKGADLTDRMIDYIIEHIGYYEVLEEYNLGYMERQISQSTYPNVTGIIIGGTRPQTRPAASKLKLEGTIYYDGVYDIEFDWHDTNNDIGGFFCKPYNLLSTNSQIVNDWIVYKKNGAKIKLIRTNFANRNDVRRWFDEVGYNQMINTVDITTKENEIEKMEKLEVVWTNLLSKASFYPIDVNK